MPRQIIEIPMNKTGIVCNSDSRDLPDHYTVSSKNIDPIAPIGRIRPIKSYTSDTNAHKTAKKAAWVNDTTEAPGLLYTDGTDLKLTKDFYGTQTYSTVSAGSVPKSMELFNKGVHLGMGNATPKWAGYSENGQFGDAASTSILYQDAECTIGEIFKPMSKVVTDGTYIWGVLDGGNAIYKFNMGAKTYNSKSEYLFDYTISLCIDGSYLWVLHKRGGTYYVSKFNTDMKLVHESSLTVTLDTDNILSDVECTTGYLWFSVYLDAVSGSAQKFYRVTRPTNNSPASLTDVTPYDGISGSAGTWDSGTPPVFMYPRKPLVRLASDVIGLAFSETGGGLLYDITSTPASVYGGIFYILDTYTKTDNYATGKIYILGFPNGANGSREYMRVAYGPANKRIYLINRQDVYKDIKSYGVLSLSYNLYDTGGYLVKDTNDTTVTTTDMVVLPYNNTGTEVQMHLFSEYSSEWSYKQNASVGSWGTQTFAVKTKIDLEFRDTGVNSGLLVAGKRYYYAVNYVFDNIQQSPLSNIYRVPLTPSDNQIEVTIKIKDIDGSYDFNKKRVTAINLFRAEGTPDGLIKDSLFRLVKTFDIKESYPLIDNDYYRLICIDDGAAGPTFEAMAEYDETIASTMVKHTYSTQLAGYRYIAKCYHDILTDAEHIVFRSKLYAYDTFDWTTDVLRVPYVPRAIKGFNNRLFVFFENLIWRVNADLQPEEDYQGIGILEDTEPLVTDEGMYWMDANGIYFHNGSVITEISIPIKTSYSSSYKSFSDTLATGTQRTITFCSEKKCVIFSSFNTNAGYMWIWHPESQQWFFWEHGTVSSYYPFAGVKGETFISTTGDFRKMFASSNYEAMEFITKKYDLGSSKQKKKWYMVKTRKNGTVSLLYAYDDSTSFSSFTESLNNLSAYNFQLKVTTTGDSYIDSAEIIVRPMIGYR